MQSARLVLQFARWYMIADILRRLYHSGEELSMANKSCEDIVLARFAALELARPGGI